MQLRVARVCLDCEEIHDATQCPACASETFAYLSQWLPSPERRVVPRRPPPPRGVSAAGPSKGRMLIGVGVLGGAAFVARWLRTAREKFETAAVHQETGDLR